MVEKCIFCKMDADQVKNKTGHICTDYLIAKECRYFRKTKVNYVIYDKIECIPVVSFYPSDHVKLSLLEVANPSNEVVELSVYSDELMVFLDVISDAPNIFAFNIKLGSHLMVNLAKAGIIISSGMIISDNAGNLYPVMYCLISPPKNN